jgi:hypothetical protein
MNIPEIYQNDDTIYHYTSTKTFLNFILPKMELRLSPRNHSNDPIEKIIQPQNYSKSLINRETTKDEIELAENIALQIGKEVFKLFTHTKQVCFCKNEMVKFENNIDQLHLEKFGFAKPRMWDQYGDKYEGICLAFSLNELSKTATEKDFKLNSIVYEKYNNIANRNNSIDLKRLMEVGYEEYLKEYSHVFLTKIFTKHEDYIHENEFRICSFHEKEKQFDYIPIKNSLKGVIISDLGLNNHLTKSIKEHLDPGILFHRLNFKHHTIRLSEIR